MLITRRSAGYSLFELLIVLAFLSGVLIFSMQLSSSKQRNTRIELLVSELIDIKNGVYAASDYLEHNVTLPALVAENLYFGSLLSPWGEPYVIEYTNAGIYVQGYAKNEQLAALVVRQLPAADFEHGWVRILVRRPQPKIDDSVYLHRKRVSSRPYLNQMRTNLDMRGNDVLNVGSLTANESELLNITASTSTLQDLVSTSAIIDHLSAVNIESGTAALQQVQANTFAVSELLVAELFAENLVVNAPLVSVQSIQVNSLHGNTLTVDDLAVANQLLVNGVQANTAEFNWLSADQLNTQNLNVGTLSANEINAGEIAGNSLNVSSLSTNQVNVSGNFQVSQLIANIIIASDFVTANTSLIEVQKLAAKVESLWLQCTVEGGCR